MFIIASYLLSYYRRPYLADSPLSFLSLNHLLIVPFIYGMFYSKVSIKNILINMKEQTLLYFKLLEKSYWRLFRNFPIVLQCLFLLMLSGILFFFAETEFTGSFTNYAVTYLIFVLIAKMICRISASEKALL